MNTGVKYGGANAALLQEEGANEAGDAAADEGDEGVGGERRGEGDLLLAEGFLQNGPSRSSVGGFPAGFGGREFLYLSFHRHHAIPALETQTSSIYFS